MTGCFADISRTWGCGKYCFGGLASVGFLIPVSKLPRCQQENIANWVSAYVRQYEQTSRAMEGQHFPS